MTNAKDVMKHWHAEVDKVTKILQSLRQFMKDNGRRVVICTDADGVFNFDAYPIKGNEHHTV